MNKLNKIFITINTIIVISTCFGSSLYENIGRAKAKNIYIENKVEEIRKKSEKYNLKI